MNTQNTENKFFTTLFATFVILIVTSFGSKEAHTQNISQTMQQEIPQVKAVATNGINPKIATVYVVGKKLPKASS
jgi:uncharacterized membrane protein